MLLSPDDVHKGPKPMNSESWYKKNVNMLNDFLLNIRNKDIPEPLPKVGDLVEVVHSYESFDFQANEEDLWIDNLTCIMDDDIKSLAVVTHIQFGSAPDSNDKEAIAFICFMQDKGEYLIALEGEIKVIS